MTLYRLLFATFSVVGFMFSGFSQERAQSTAAKDDPIVHNVIKLSGPRFGVTSIKGAQGDMLEQAGLSTLRSQFGWQFETRYFETESGFQGLIEWVPLVAGLETDDPALSLNLLVGFRTRSGFEMGVGPNVSTAGGGEFAIIYAAGYSVKFDNVYFPINFAIAPSSESVKYTLLVGFNLRNR